MRRAYVSLFVFAVIASLSLPMHSRAQERERKRPPVTHTSEPRTLKPRDIFEKYARSVVFITNLDDRGEPQATGTGFIVSSDGVLITNYHVIEGASDAQIKLSNGEVYDRVRVLDYDKRRDIAVLRIRATGLPVVPLGDSEKVVQGDDVVAIGNPKGLEQTLTVGVISARRTDLPGKEGTSLLQTQTPISPGSSGGPLFNSRGEVIGITTLAVTGGGSQNLNFAVEIKYAKLMLSNPPMNITLADVVAKEHPRTERQERASNSGGSNPPPPPPAAGGGGGKSDSTIFVGTDYTEPKGVVTITLKDGWRPDQTKDANELLNLTNGGAYIYVHQKSSSDSVDSLFDAGEGVARKIFVSNFTNHGKKVRDTIEGHPVAVQWFKGTMESGRQARLLVGIWGLPSANVQFLGLVAETNDKDFSDVTDMFFSLRSASDSSRAGGGGGGTGGGGTQSGNLYRDPAGYASLELQPSWGPDTTDKDANSRLMTLTNGRSFIWVYHEPNSTDARRLWQEYYDALAKKFAKIEPDSQMVDSEIEGRPVKAQWLILTSQSGGNPLRVLLGATVSRSGGLVLMGINKGDSGSDDRALINKMFVTLK